MNHATHTITKLKTQTLEIPSKYRVITVPFPTRHKNTKQQSFTYYIIDFRTMLFDIFHYNACNKIYYNVNSPLATAHRYRLATEP